jgi:hypothetical protein
MQTEFEITIEQSIKPQELDFTVPELVHVRESCGLLGDVAPSAEPFQDEFFVSAALQSLPTNQSILLEDGKDDVRISIDKAYPNNNISTTIVTTTTYQKVLIFNQMCSTFITVTKTIWSSIESVSEWFTDAVGITAPRYEMYIDDSIEFLAAEEQNEYRNREIEQEGVLMDAISG